ncbi:MAG TPA: anti-sigma-F factor Fin [Sporosarcina sp.]|nr:anti-sigma-F factor Fin [Sporosarcina sp.]
MAIRYKCRHCATEVGSLPFGSAKETVRMLHQLNEGEEENFVTTCEKGHLTVQCICEQCEKSLREFPDYYSLGKWLQ